ncbi:M48 family metallopeptidase [Synechocystis sp. LKSZ1]|uniref:M48 family metallopeptidase n=1 Tax=Synechocystis sp. LKSZ1 TaxID=3144951 RepID=UPI00336BE21B
MVYRIVDRIARANNLDQTPWRVVTINKYDVNAFATDTNLIALYTGLLDQVEGDPSAVACVVGHEMAHHTQRHVAMGEAEKQALLQKFTEEARIEVEQEQQAAQNDAVGAAIGATLFGGLGRVIGGIGGSATEAVGGVVAISGQQRIEQAQIRMAQIVKEKQLAFEQQQAENDRRQEFEADQHGYVYMARAGFDPKGCLRLMQVMARLPGSEMDSTHPATRKRISQLETLMVEKPATSLAQEGKLLLDTSKPLTYSVSRDDQSLRVNSRYGGSTANTIDKMF